MAVKRTQSAHPQVDQGPMARQESRPLPRSSFSGPLAAARRHIVVREDMCRPRLSRVGASLILGLLWRRGGRRGPRTRRTAPLRGHFSLRRPPRGREPGYRARLRSARARTQAIQTAGQQVGCPGQKKEGLARVSLGRRSLLAGHPRRLRRAESGRKPALVYLSPPV